MPKRRSLITLTTVALLMQSCVEFAEQSTTFVYDAQTDSLRMVQVYHGIFGGENEARLDEKELEQLRHVMDEAKTFFYANWIFEYSEDGAREAIEKMQENPDDKDADEAAMHSASIAMFESLIENVRVRNGGFYRDKAGRLCGWQTIAITRTGEVLKVANAAISKLILNGLQKDELEWSEPTRALLKAAASDSYQWLDVGSNTLRFQMPMRAADYRQIRQDLAASTREEAAEKAGKASILTFTLAGILPVELGIETESYGEMQHWVDRLAGMIASDMDVWWADDTMTVRVGHSDDAPAHFSMPVFDGYVDNAGADAERLYGVLDTLDIDAKTKAFLEQK